MLRPDEIRKASGFRFVSEPDPRYSITIFEPPKPDHIYGGGIDTALGIPGKDRDTLVVLDRETWPFRQVCEVVGHLGDQFHKVVYAVTQIYFGNLFLVVERAAMGIMLLRALQDDYGYGWLYHQQVMDQKTQTRTPRLGYAKNLGASDPIVTELRRGIAQGEIEVNSATLADELAACQFKARDTLLRDDATDSDMKVKLAGGGGSPDLMMALAYAYRAVREVGSFPKPAMQLQEGSLGKLFGYDTEDFARPAPRPESDHPYGQGGRVQVVDLRSARKG